MPNSFHFQLQGRGPGRVSTLGAVFDFSERPLLQLHEEQDEDRPDPDSYRKLCRLCISQKRPSSWNCKGKQEHSHSREYSED